MSSFIKGRRSIHSSSSSSSGNSNSSSRMKGMEMVQIDT